MAGFKTQIKPFTSWSNTRYNDYAKCPAYAMYKHLMKLPEPKSEAMQRGADIAKLEEGFFDGSVKLPKLKTVVHPNVIGDLQAAKKQKTLMFEQNWGFDREWKEVDYFDWNNCALRVKVDFGWTDIRNGRVSLRDNKTGKFSQYDVEKYMLQLDLYTAAAAGRFPQVEEFDVQLIYTDLGIRYPQEPLIVTRKEALKSQKAWDKRVKPMFADRKFPPKPNNTCKWCAFSQAKGGPCKF